MARKPASQQPSLLDWVSPRATLGETRIPELRDLLVQLMSEIGLALVNAEDRGGNCHEQDNS